MTSFVFAQLRRHAKLLVRLERRFATAKLPGKVIERDEEKRQVRLDLGPDPDTGATVKSPWVRVQSGSAGKVKQFVLPSIGEQMYLDSPSGIIGADSVARYGTFTTTNPHPTPQEADEHILESGTTRVSMKDGQTRTSVGPTSTTRTAAGQVHKGPTITHDTRKQIVTGPVHLATGGTTV